MSSIIPLEKIQNRIYLIHREKVMLDRDLAELYGVETRVLKQAVKRNIERFPADFMFELSDEEIEYMVSQSVIPSKSLFGGALPMAFTEQGVAMLSSVLRSERAVKVNIAIMRAFVALRRMIAEYEELNRRMAKIERKQDKLTAVVFKLIEELNAPPDENTKRIGFETDDCQKIMVILRQNSELNSEFRWTPSSRWRPS